MKIKTFLCCFELETGGLTIGWMTLIWYLIFALISAVSIIAVSTTSCVDLKAFLMEYFNIDLDEKIFFDLCNSSRGIVIFTLTGIFVFCICFVFFGYQCVRGVTLREPGKIRVLSLYMLFGAILCCIGSLTLSVEGIVTALVYGFIYFYFFLVLHSLIGKLKDENLNSPEILYQPS